MIPISFTLNDKKDIGILFSKSFEVEKDFILEKASQSDFTNFFVNLKDNNKYSFIDSNELYVYFYESGENIKIEKNTLNINSNFLYDAIEKQFNKVSGILANVPLYFSNTFNLFSSITYSDALYNNANTTEGHALYNTNLKSQLIDMDINKINKIIYSSNKNYKIFLDTAEGVYGLSNQDTLQKLIDSNLSFVSNKNILYEKDGCIFLTKISTNKYLNN